MVNSLRKIHFSKSDGFIHSAKLHFPEPDGFIDSANRHFRKPHGSFTQQNYVFLNHMAHSLRKTTFS